MFAILYFLFFLPCVISVVWLHWGQFLSFSFSLNLFLASDLPASSLGFQNPIPGIKLIVSPNTQVPLSHGHQLRAPLNSALVS